MKGGVWPNVRLRVIALAVAGTLAGTFVHRPVYAQPSPDRLVIPRPSRPNSGSLPRQARQPRYASHDRLASDVMFRTAVPTDLDQRRRDGHMTPDERRLLRQHIEDAVRDLYKR
ncbi:hypothetical protein [Paraburkholderia sp.]|uniref:hypothetical protein n=1 Tax=Paraburkholderia sp. TaxID=1926495 RepID=UPI00239F962A|nr:hypothetical protein [Paraburkholderia sp.]MDE1184383.1 hypothetical protein [Paraburkholderia sp.]